MSGNQGWGWAGSIDQFLQLSQDELMTSLADHHIQLLNDRPSSGQMGAWQTEHEVMIAVLSSVERGDSEWSVVFEYELPLEGGRRPDVVVLAGETVVVLEFKGGLLSPTRAAVDQVNAYARNLAEYHEETHQSGLGRMEASVVPVLVLPSTTDVFVDTDEALVVSPDNLGDLLSQLATKGHVNLDQWLRSAYAHFPLCSGSQSKSSIMRRCPTYGGPKSALVPRDRRAGDPDSPK